MQIILLTDIANLGHKDDVINVKPGYGRNYLIPQGPGRVLNIQGTAKQAVPFCVVLPALLAHGSCQTLSYFCSISA